MSFYGSQWGIVAAMLFVSAPFAVNSARVAFETIDPRLEQRRPQPRRHPVARVPPDHPAARPARGADRRRARLRPLDQRVRRGRDHRLLPGDRPGRDLQPVPAIGLTQSASAAVVLLIVTLATFLVFRTLASGRLLARVNRAYT